MRRKQFVLLRHITKLPVNDFKWVKDISGFDESFIKSYDEETDEGNFPANDSQYPKVYITCTTIYHFYLKE